MPKSFNAPAAGEIAATIAGYRDAFHSFILDNEEIPGELTEELADYVNHPSPKGNGLATPL